MMRSEISSEERMSSSSSQVNYPSGTLTSSNQRRRDVKNHNNNINNNNNSMNGGNNHSYEERPRNERVVSRPVANGIAEDDSADYSHNNSFFFRNRNDKPSPVIISRDKRHRSNLSWWRSIIRSFSGMYWNQKRRIATWSASFTLFAILMATVSRDRYTTTPRFWRSDGVVRRGGGRSAREIARHSSSRWNNPDLNSNGADGKEVYVFQSQPEPTGGKSEAREMNRMRAMLLAPLESSSSVQVRHEVMNGEEQRSFLERHGSACYPHPSATATTGTNLALQRFDDFDPLRHRQYRTELWKYCALALRGGAFIDTSSPLLETFQDAFQLTHNYAVLGSAYPGTAHGSFLLFTQPDSNVALSMVRLLVETGNRQLDASPLMLPKLLYDAIARDVGLDPSLLPLVPGQNEKWMVLEQRCHDTLVDGTSSQRRTRDGDDGGEVTSTNVPETARLTQHCPSQSGYCCEILNPTTQTVVMLTRHPVLPSQYIPPSSSLPKPYFHHIRDTHPTTLQQIDLPYISTLREQTFHRPFEFNQTTSTPNLFDILHAQDCLPVQKTCSDCLRNKKGADCETCKEECGCYCRALCRVRPEDKFVSKQVTLSPPLYKKDPSRLVPRIVHQTWFEAVTKEKYPNMSRLIESWKRSGWEYRFYDDESAGDFLSTHFPPEVREAYDSVIPGAFKADLFRYCTLLVNGGVYADMDVMLEANLDAAVSDEVGFMTPVDEPGSPANHRMCLWNGFIASSPGHPFLARAIQIVVNNIRNRFTSVDIDNLLCPNPELSVSHAFDTLFTAGPCILGASINDVLKNHLQTQFEPGDIIPSSNDDNIPGRTVILQQNKIDMGAHRFTWMEQNLVVAATDMPDYDDRKNLEDNKHYSDTHVKTGIYGLEKLYVDNDSANEEIRIVVGKEHGWMEEE